MTAGQPAGREGKVPPEFLERVVFANLGAKRGSVLVRPGHGLDNAVISLGGSKVLLVTSDPLSVIPSLGWEVSGWLSVHLLASDLATSGVSPQFAMLDFNLPPKMDLASVETYLKAVGKECGNLGIAIVGGHTGRYPGSGYTVVGGGVMFSVTHEGSYVTPAMARPGDTVLMTKGAGVGATAVLAHSFPQAVGEKVGTRLLRKARSRLLECSTVKDAAAAAGVGLHTAVTSMHDATEGGVLGGLLEMSSACGFPIVVELEKINVPDDVAAVCRVFGLDPLVTLSEGTLLITCRRSAVELVQTALAKAGVVSHQVATVGTTRRGRGLWSAVRGSNLRPLSPVRDRYWEAYSSAVERGLR